MASIGLAMRFAAVALLCMDKIPSAQSIKISNTTQALVSGLVPDAAQVKKSCEHGGAELPAVNAYDAPSASRSERNIASRKTPGDLLPKKEGLMTESALEIGSGRGGPEVRAAPDGQASFFFDSSDDEDDYSWGSSTSRGSDVFSDDDEEEKARTRTNRTGGSRPSPRSWDFGNRFESVKGGQREERRLSRSFDELGKDRTWIGEINDSGSDYSNAPSGLSIQRDEDIYFQAVDTIPGIGFLGSGYDMVMGNPLGDEHSPGDPGFKAPVIAFDWGHDKEGVSPDLTTLQPKGGYVRPFVSCQRAEKVEEIESLQDYVADLAADASTDAALPYLPFSGSFNFRQLAEESSRKQTKTFVLRAYCFRYEAGLASPGRTSSTTTDAFKKAVANLPVAFPSTPEGSNCTAAVYKKNSQSPECADAAIVRWMEFFADFGTHVTTNIKLGRVLWPGGKVTKQIRILKEQAQELHNKTMRGSVSAEVAFREILAADGSKHNGSATAEANSSFAVSTTTYAVGGRPPRDPSNPQELTEWAKSVAALPMPIQYVLQSLSRLLPENLHPAYRSASAFYAKVFGVTREEMDALTSPSERVKETLRKSTAVAWAGQAPGFVDCPRGKKILFGFAMHINVNTTGSPLAIKACESGSFRCEGPNVKNSPQSDTRIWAVCGENTIDSLETFSSIDPLPEATVGCSQDKEILFGLQISFSYGKAGLINVSVAHCSPGAKECRFQDMGSLQQDINSHHLFFAACVGRQLPGLHNLFAASSAGVVGTSQAVDRAKTAATDCGPNASHVTGFAMQLHSLMPLVRDAFNTCPDESRYCALKKFIIPPPVEVEKIWGKASKTLKHSSLAFAICALKESISPNALRIATSKERTSQDNSAASAATASPGDEPPSTPREQAQGNPQPTQMEA